MTFTLDVATWIAFLASISAGLWAVMRYLLAEMQKIELACEREIAGLHERVNRTRDEFVRREDLDRHVGRLESSVSDLRTDLRELVINLTARVDALVASLNKNYGQN